MTMTRRDLMGSALAAGLMASPLAGAVRFDRRGGGFAIAAGDGRVSPVFVDAGDLAGVRRAAADLAADIGRVTGTPAPLLHHSATLPKTVILVGTLGHSPVIDRLVAAGRLDVANVRGRWEAFAIQTVADPMPGVAEALVIVGSDKRGAIYGAYEISRMIGVSPWYWWADVPVVRQAQVSIARGRYVQGSPAVKYRGIFLNDEAPCLSGWTTETFGGMNAQFYGRLFELLLRLRANYLWPAMWNNAFAIDDPANAPLADEYGIVMGSSHHEPMMRAHKEWTDHRADYGNGQWNYATNRDGVRRFFQEGIARNRDHEVVVTVGMRGDGDVALESTGDLQSDVRLLEGVIGDQRRIIADGMGRPAEQVPQVWVLFTEVYRYYDAGLSLPDDVMLMFADDNVGNLRRLPKPDERGRKGGFGVYFHMDMHGGPFAYQWINSNPLPKIWEQMNLAHQYGADAIWIANVGDLKPLELPVEFFLAMAWNPADVGKDRIADWTRAWAGRQFGADHADEIAFLAARYVKYNAQPKPEQLRPGTYSLDHHREAERVCAGWDDLVRRADAVNAALRPDQRDAFFQLVLYPVRACANCAQMYVAAARNARFAEQARASTRAEAAEVRRRFRYDRDLRDSYNHVMAGGKWNHMMDQTHIGYFDWYPPETDIMPAVADIDLATPDDFGVAVDGSARCWPGYYLPPRTADAGQRDAAADLSRGVSARRRARPRHRRRQCPMGHDPRGSRVQRVAARPALLDRHRLDQSAGRPVRGEHHRHRQDQRDRKADCDPRVRGAASRRQGRLWRPGGRLRDPGYRLRTRGRGRGRAVGSDSRLRTGRRRHVDLPGRCAFVRRSRDRAAAGLSGYLPEAGDYRVDLVTGPTLEVIPGRPLRVAVALDDRPFAIGTVFTPEDRVAQDFLGTKHAVNAANNARIMTFTVSADRPGRHRLTIAMIDPTIVLQSIAIARGTPPATFFGPPVAARN